LISTQSWNPLASGVWNQTGVSRSLKAQTIAATNIEDMLFSSTTTAESDTVVADISKHYQITDDHNVNFHLGCAIIGWQACGIIKVHQEAFTVSILHDAGMKNSKPVTTPMNPCVRLKFKMCPTTQRRHKVHVPYKQ
jgi:Reverse transcriptase (RNA-dependent DNA polymerase)